MTSSEMLFSAPYMMMIHPPAPVQNAITVKITGRLSRSTVWMKLVNPNRLQDDGHRAHARVEQEEPEHDARRTRERSGDVEQEARGRGQPPDAHGVDDERQQDDEHDQGHQPDRQEGRDVLHGREEPEVAEDLHEVVEPDELPALGE